MPRFELKLKLAIPPRTNVMISSPQAGKQCDAEYACCLGKGEKVGEWRGPLYRGIRAEPRRETSTFGHERSKLFSDIQDPNLHEVPVEGLDGCEKGSVGKTKELSDTHRVTYLDAKAE